MLIIRDNVGVTIKQTVQSVNYVRIGAFKTILWVDGTARSVRHNGKPHGEFDINDCSDLLKELESLVAVGLFTRSHVHTSTRPHVHTSTRPTDG